MRLIYDSEEPCQGNKYYAKWKSLFHRVNKVPFYKDCTVCKSWEVYSNFKNFLIDQNTLNGTDSMTGYQLDKDLLSEGKGFHYSPETCMLIPQEINKFTTFNKKGMDRRNIGGHLDRRDGYWYVICNNPFTKSAEHFGRASSAEEAHEIWRRAKASFCVDLAKSIHRKDLREALMSLSTYIRSEGFYEEK